MSNPLLQERGLPAFSTIRAEHVEPAVDAVLADNRRRIDELLASGARTWDELIVPLQQMEHRLNRTWSPVSHLNAVRNGKALRSAYNACLPRLSAYATELGQNEALYRAYEEVAAACAGDEDEARRRVVDNALRDFRLAGVALAPDRKRRFRELMQELTQLEARFEENILDAGNAWSLQVEDESRLAGVPAGALQRAREEAARRELAGWVFTLDYPAYHAVISHAHDEALRREFYTAWVTRASDQGPNAGRWDNSEVMEQILRLRHEAARLLGLASFAEYSLASKMAASAQDVLAFLHDLAARSVEPAQREFDALQSLAGREIAAWDVAYYAERLRRERYDISDEELRPYFPVDRVMTGLFAIVEQIYEVRVSEREGVDVWHPDVRLFEISNADGTLRGAFYVDLFARSAKRNGAWMDDCIGRKRLDADPADPVAYLCCNFMPPVGNAPALLTHDEVVTLFHEFGHVLHHLLTRVDYPTVAGINGVPWDAVELPSQFMENFAWQREVLPLISGHYQTGEALPEPVFERLRGTRVFNAGLQMVRQLEFALFDMRLHAEYDPARGAGQIAEILQQVRQEVCVVPVPSWNRFAHGFSHIFGGGYAAGYYSYKWAEVLSADAFGAFEETRVLDRSTGRRFLDTILARGGTVDAMEAFVAFRGREPKLDALLRHNGMLAGPA